MASSLIVVGLIAFRKAGRCCNSTIRSDLISPILRYSVSFIRSYVQALELLGWWLTAHGERERKERISECDTIRSASSHELISRSRVDSRAHDEGSVGAIGWGNDAKQTLIAFRLSPTLDLRVTELPRPVKKSARLPRSEARATYSREYPGEDRSEESDQSLGRDARRRVPRGICQGVPG